MDRVGALRGPGTFELAGMEGEGRDKRAPSADTGEAGGGGMKAGD